MSKQKIAIVGGGPAGAFAAEILARAGREVLLFDERLAWEKPCGGGLTPKAVSRWPFLRDASVERNWISHCELIAPSGRKVNFALDREIAIFSRLALNGLLLRRAEDAGARVVRERIVEIAGSAGACKLRASSGTYDADFVILAAGARHSFHGRFTQALGPENFVVALGYYIPGTRQTIQIKFLPGLHGYIWIFPRADHFSAGICGRMDGKNTADLRAMLEASLPEFGLSREGAKFYAHIIPSFTADTWRNIRMAGDGWARVGDAAGLVDGITGEGLYYALRSAEIFADAILQGAPEEYDALVRQELISELARAAAISNRFYAGDWMGAPVIERMIGLTVRSPHFRDLMRDLFAGTQEYLNLKQRVRSSLPRIAVEALVSTLWRPQKDLVPSAQRARAAS